MVGAVVFFVLRPFIPDPFVLARTWGRIRALDAQIAANPANVTARRDLAVIWLERLRPRRASSPDEARAHPRRRRAALPHRHGPRPLRRPRGRPRAAGQGRRDRPAGPLRRAVPRGGRGAPRALPPRRGRGRARPLRVLQQLVAPGLRAPRRRAQAARRSRGIAGCPARGVRHLVAAPPVSEKGGASGGGSGRGRRASPVRDGVVGPRRGSARAEHLQVGLELGDERVEIVAARGLEAREQQARREGGEQAEEPVQGRRGLVAEPLEVRATARAAAPPRPTPDLSPRRRAGSGPVRSPSPGRRAGARGASRRRGPRRAGAARGCCRARPPPPPRSLAPPGPGTAGARRRRPSRGPRPAPRRAPTAARAAPCPGTTRPREAPAAPVRQDPQREAHEEVQDGQIADVHGLWPSADRAASSTAVPRPPSAPVATTGTGPRSGRPR